MREIAITAQAALITLAASVFLAGCLSYTPAAAPILTGCVGECGTSLSSQLVLPGPPSPIGCPDTQCTLQIEVVGGDLCPNESAHVTVKRGPQLLWQKPYTFHKSPFPGVDPAKVGEIELIATDVVRPGDVLSISATVVPNDNDIACKKQGSFLFSITVLH